MLSLTPFLILPIVGGYYFSKAFMFTQWLSAREDGHRLYFRAIFWGVVLTILTSLIFASLYYFFERFYMEVLQVLSILSGNEGYPVHPYGKEAIFLILCFSMFLGPVVGHLINYGIAILDSSFFEGKTLPMFPEQQAETGYLKGRLLYYIVSTSDFELLVFSAYIQQTLIIFSLKNRKFYVGIVLSAPNPSAERKHIRIMPAFSGYRDELTHRTHFTTDYLKIYKEYRKHPEYYSLTEDKFYRSFDVVIPAEQIVSCHPHEEEIYKLFDMGPKVWRLSKASKEWEL